MSDDKIQKYRDYAREYNEGLAAFRLTYEARTPPPEMSEVKQDRVSLIIVCALSVVMVASIIVSSSRTIHEFGGDVIGTMAFVMLEGGLVAYSFFRARRNSSMSKLEDARRLATYGLALAFIVAIGANVDSVLSSHGVHIPQEVNTVINLLVAVSAPVLAFISADVLALELMAVEIKRQHAVTAYEKQYREWLDGLARSWAVQRPNWGIKIEVEPPKELPSGEVSAMSDKTGQTGQKRTKAVSASDRVRAHLDSTPDDVGLSVRELSEKIGVGKSTVATVLKEYVTVE